MPSLFTQAIEEAYATAKTVAVVVYTIEINHSAWTSPVLITNYGNDFQAYDEGSVLKTFVNSSFKAKRTIKDDQGRVSMSIELDNTNLSVKQLIEQALEVNENPTLVFRVYLSTDITQPAEFPLNLIVESSSSNVMTVTLNCTNGDDINLQFPRPEFDYKAANFPGLVR